MCDDITCDRSVGGTTTGERLEEEQTCHPWVARSIGQRLTLHRSFACGDQRSWVPALVAANGYNSTWKNKCCQQMEIMMRGVYRVLSMEAIYDELSKSKHYFSRVDINNPDDFDDPDDFDENYIKFKILMEFLDISDNYGQTLLHQAVFEGDYEITRFLLENIGDDIFLARTIYDKYTALHTSAMREDEKIIDLLIDEAKKRGQKCIDLTRKKEFSEYIILSDNHGQTALHCAIERGTVNICVKLYNLIINNPLYLESLTIQTQHKKETILHLAIERCNLEIVSLLLPEINDPNSSPSGLLLSIKSITKFLLLREDGDGYTPLHLIATSRQYNNVKDISLLHGSSVVINSPPGPSIISLLFQRAYDLHDDTLHTLIDGKLNIACLAAYYNHYNVLKCFIENIEKYEIDFRDFVSKCDGRNESLLHWATWNGYYEICEILCNLMNSDQINIQSLDKSHTALHIAVTNNHKKIVRLLLSKGSIPDLQNAEGMTPLMLAKDKPKIINLINKHQNIQKIKDLQKDKTSYFNVIPSDIIGLVRLIL